MSNVNNDKAVAAVTTPYTVEFLEGFVPVTGNILEVGDTYYQLGIDGLWWVCTEPVKAGEVDWGYHHVKNMTAVSDADTVAEELIAGIRVPEAPFKAAKPEEGEVTYSPNAPDDTMEFRMGGATIAQIEMVQKAFPNMEHRGDGYFVLSLAVAGMPNMGNETKQLWGSIIYNSVNGIMRSSAPGYVREVEEVATEQVLLKPFPQFLSNQLSAPPRSGSDEMNRQLAIKHAIDHHSSETTVDDALVSLGRHVEELDLTEHQARGDVTIKALGALARVKRENAKRKNRKWAFGMACVSLLAAIGFVATTYAQQNVVTSNYTTVTECKIPFGDQPLEGKRFRTYKYKSLLGYRFGGNDDITTERTEVKLPGSGLTILGRDDERTKPWRMSYAKGDYGTAILKKSDLYWFVGSNDVTTLVNDNEFCH